MSIAFAAELDKPLTMRELADASEAMLVELLGLPAGQVRIRILDAEYWWKHQSDRDVDPAWLAASSHGPDVPDVLFTLSTGDRGCIVSLGVVTRAGDLRSCQSIATGIGVTLAAARGWGRTVDPPGELCPDLPLDDPNVGRPVEEVIDCLRLAPADRTLEEAAEALLERSVYHPCEADPASL